MFQINIASRNLEIEKDLTDYLSKNIRRSFRYFAGIISIHTTLYKEKGQFRTEITINGDGFSIHASEVNKKDLHLTIDKAIERAREQLKRHKDRIREKKRRHLPKKSTTEPIQFRRVDQEPISLEEAILRLDLCKDPFLAFINSDSNELNVLYREEKGGYGLIHP